MRFIIEPEKRSPIVSLRGDDGDVDILIDNILVAYFDGDDGTLHLCPLEDGEHMELGQKGMVIDIESGCPKITHFAEETKGEVNMVLNQTYYPYLPEHHEKYIQIKKGE